MVALVLAVSSWYLVRAPYSHVVAASGARVLSLMSGMPADEIVRVHDGEFYLDTGLRGSSGQPLPYVRLPVNQVHWNLILFLSLLYVTPWRLWRRCWKALLVAFLVLVLSHVAFFTLTVLGEVASRHQEAGMELFGQGTITALAVSVQIYSLIFEKALPFLLFIPVFMAWRRPRAAVRKVDLEGKVGRNAPCPCGSGKKYKNCCLGPNTGSA